MGLLALPRLIWLILGWPIYKMAQNSRKSREAQCRQLHIQPQNDAMPPPGQGKKKDHRTDWTTYDQCAAQVPAWENFFAKNGTWIMLALAAGAFIIYKNWKK